MHGGNPHTEEKITGLSAFFAVSRFQDCDSCPQMRRGIVRKLQHERMAFERLLHDGALDAYAAAVDEPHFAEPRCVRCRHIFLDDRWDVSRCERVEV